MKFFNTLAITTLFLFSASSFAGVYKCMVNGKLVFSDTACVTNAESVHIDPVPRDSLDNPETAERYRQQQEIKRQQQEIEEHNRAIQVEQERQEFNRQASEAQRQSHEKAVEGKLDSIKEELVKTRKQAARPKVCTSNQYSYGSYSNGTTICR